MSYDATIYSPHFERSGELRQRLAASFVRSISSCSARLKAPSARRLRSKDVAQAQLERDSDDTLLNISVLIGVYVMNDTQTKKRHYNIGVSLL